MLFQLHTNSENFLISFSSFVQCILGYAGFETSRLFWQIFETVVRNHFDGRSQKSAAFYWGGRFSSIEITNQVTIFTTSREWLNNFPNIFATYMCSYRIVLWIIWKTNYVHFLFLEIYFYSKLFSILKVYPANIRWSSRRLEDMSWRRLEDMSWRRVEDISWRCLEDMSWRCLEDILETNKILTGDICILIWG